MRIRAASHAGGGGTDGLRLRGVHGPFLPAELIEDAQGSPRSPSTSSWDEGDEDAAEELLLLQSAIDKAYRLKLLQFRRAATPAAIADIRASLPPQHRPQLEAILREAAGLADGGDGLEDLGGFDALELTEEEAAALDALGDSGAVEGLPGDFFSYLSQLVPGADSEDRLETLLGQIPAELLNELQALFWEIKEFEASAADHDTDVVADRYVALSDRISALSEEVDRRQEEHDRRDRKAAAEEEQRRQQQERERGPQQQQQRRRPRGPDPPPGLFDTGSSGVGESAYASRSSGTVVGPSPATPSWQQARQQQQQRRSVAAWATGGV